MLSRRGWVNTVSMHEGELLGGRYRLQDVIGVGGMAEVWRAQDEVLNRAVAVKVLAGPDLVDAAGRGLMLAEAQAAALLTHPHITSVHDYGESRLDSGESVAFVVMELLHGRTLSEEAADGPLPPQAAIAICAEVASALAAAHAQGLVHRDIKPSNVIVTPAGAKVLDFGIAAFSGAGGLEPTGRLLGTPTYVAPERLTGDDVSPASDVYALGVLLYWLLAGDFPWRTSSPTATLRARLLEDPRPLGPLPDVSDDVRQICRGCLDRSPAARPTAAEVAGVLAAAAMDHNLVAPPAVEPVAPTRSRRRTLVVSGLLVLALLGLVAAVQLTSRPDHPETGAPAAAVEPGTTGAVAVPGGPAASSPTPTPTPVDPTTPAGVPVLPVPPTTATTAPVVPPDPGPSTPPVPNGDPISAEGGTIWVGCDGKATVLSVAPESGYTVTDAAMGPAVQVRVVFTAPGRESDIRARCTGVGVMPTVVETPPLP